MDGEKHSPGFHGPQIPPDIIWLSIQFPCCKCYNQQSLISQQSFIHFDLNKDFTDDHSVPV